jgi:flavin reductase (DIM6/NTAB) family NADH-FMN oxidoreductase RutF
MTDKAKRLLAPGTVLYPAPAVLVTCGDLTGEKNAITLAWVGTASSEPPCIAIGVRPTRYSYGLIQRYGDFVVNLPRADQVGILEYCGSVSGRTEDKFAKAGITAARADSVRAPLVAEFPVNIECKVKSRIPLGSHDLFVGEVLAVHADPDVLTDGEIDPAKADPVAFFRGSYYRLGDRVATRNR